MIIYGADKSNLVEIDTFFNEGNTIRFKGKIMGAMPITAVVTPSQLRKLFFTMGFKMIFFGATMLFRRDPKEFSSKK